jgi:hypothetical protein
MIKNKELLMIAVTIFFTVVAWVLLEVMSIRDDTPTEAQIESVNLNYSIDTSVLKELSDKQK